MKRHGFIDEQLAEVDLFRGMGAPGLRRVTSLMTRVERDPGAFLAAEGRRGSQFVLILDGNATVWVEDRMIAALGPGDFLGEISLLGARPQTATVLVASRVAVAVASRPDFWELLDTAPRANDRVRRVMGERLAVLEAVWAEAGGGSPTGPAPGRQVSRPKVSG